MSWVIRVEEQLPLMKFAHNNSYQASVRMAPYEALFGRPCRSLLGLTEVEESSITGLDLIRDTSEFDTTLSSHGSEPAEELCGCVTSTLRVRGWGSCLLEGDA